MGRFERKIKKKIKNNTEDFEVWFEKNQSQLNGFSEKNELSRSQNRGNVLTKTFKSWVPFFACVGCLLIMVVVLSVLFTKGTDDFDMKFGDESVYASLISDEELQTVAETYPFINKMQVTAQGELLLRTDDSLVFTIIDGELETEEDYYFIKVQIEHNKNYEFGYKIAYQNLKNNKIINGWVIGYEQKSIDPNDLYVFYLHLQNNNGQVIYMEVHCFENDISYILNEFI